MTDNDPDGLIAGAEYHLKESMTWRVGTEWAHVKATQAVAMALIAIAKTIREEIDELRSE